MKINLGKKTNLIPFFSYVFFKILILILSLVLAKLGPNTFSLGVFMDKSNMNYETLNLDYETSKTPKAMHHK
jgi:hypothetical protein